jgi:hypothetical protein
VHDCVPINGFRQHHGFTGGRIGSVGIGSFSLQPRRGIVFDLRSPPTGRRRLYEIDKLSLELEESSIRQKAQEADFSPTICPPCYKIICPDMG